MANCFVTKQLAIQYTNRVVITQTCVGECGLGERHHKTSMHIINLRKSGSKQSLQLASIHAYSQCFLKLAMGPTADPQTCSYQLNEREVSVFQVKLCIIKIEQIDCASINNCLGVDSSGGHRQGILYCTVTHHRGLAYLAHECKLHTWRGQLNHRFSCRLHCSIWPSIREFPVEPRRECGARHG